MEGLGIDGMMRELMWAKETGLTAILALWRARCDTWLDFW